MHMTQPLDHIRVLDMSRILAGPEAERQGVPDRPEVRPRVQQRDADEGRASLLRQVLDPLRALLDPA